MRKIAVFFVVLFLANVVSAADTQQQSATESVLLKVRVATDVALDKMDASLAAAARELSNTGLASRDARIILRKLCKDNKYAIDCATVDLKGKMVLVEPDEYKKFEGSDISKQEQVRRIRWTKRPVLSKVFKSVEGINAVDFEYPVFSSKGKFIGSVSILFKAEALLSDMVLPAIMGVNVDVWAMQKDGIIIYDQDNKQIGKNIFTDELYKPFPTVINFCRRVAALKSGADSYEFYERGTKNLVTKKAHWATANVADMEWRIVALTVAGIKEEKK